MSEQWGNSFLLSFSYIGLRLLLVVSQFSLIYYFNKDKKRICHDEISVTQKKVEFISNIKANIFEGTMLALFISSGMLNTTSLTTFSFFGTFILCYVFFEIWFYFSHRLLHTQQFRSIHKVHHVSIVTTPLSAQTMDLREKMINDIGLYIVPTLFSFILPLNFEGFMSYHFLNFYFNVLGHCNIELVPKQFAHSKIGQLFTTATYHSMHHLKGQYNMGLFTTVCDRLFGTYDPTYIRFYDQVVDSVPTSRHDVLCMAKKQACT